MLKILKFFAFMFNQFTTINKVSIEKNAQKIFEAYKIKYLE